MKTAFVVKNLVRGRLDCTQGDERPVATRLESIEDMLRGVVDRLTRMETIQNREVRPQVQLLEAPAPAAHGPVYNAEGGGRQQSYAAATAANISFVPNKQVKQFLNSRERRNSSVKRSISSRLIFLLSFIFLSFSLPPKAIAGC